MEMNNLTDEEFDSLLPVKMKKLSGTHWTPVEVVKKAIAFLNELGGKSVLDLGSGAGKFCLLAASNSDATITGVEQRENLVQLSRKLAEKYEVLNVNFVHDDLQKLDFLSYDSFYFFNAFEENINPTDKLDKYDQLSLDLYTTYIKLLREKFAALPKHTRIVTYCGEALEIPESYRLVKSGNKGKLRFWEKEV
jgi:SAM-dependent methyltransferase